MKKVVFRDKIDVNCKQNCQNSSYQNLVM